MCILALGFQVRLKWYTVLRTCGSEVHPCTPWRHTGRLLSREAWVEWDRTRRTSHIVLVQRQRSPHGTSRHPPGMRMMSGPTSIDPCLTVFKIELECKSNVCPQAFASQLCGLVGPFFSTRMDLEPDALGTSSRRDRAFPKHCDVCGPSGARYHTPASWARHVAMQAHQAKAAEAGTWGRMGSAVPSSAW